MVDITDEELLNMISELQEKAFKFVLDYPSNTWNYKDTQERLAPYIEEAKKRNIWNLKKE